MEEVNQMRKSFDVIVVGAGPAGYVAAIRAAQLGMKVALIDKRERLGGTCLNVGCVPSKALLESSELFERLRQRVGSHGIEVGEVAVDVGTMMARKDRIVEQVTGGLRLLMRKNRISTFTGTATLVDEQRVSVTGAEGSVELSGGNVIIATGSEPIELPFLRFDGRWVVSSTEALCFDRPPEHLVVVGAGAVGLELGTVWNRLGSRVTVIELLPRIIPVADRQLSTLLLRELKKQGMQFHLGTKVTDSRIEGDRVVLAIQGGKGELEEITCDRVLVAVGRRPVTAGSGIERLDIALDRGGRIEVDERFRTSRPGIYAIGDVIRGPMLAHKAQEEGVAVAETIAGSARSIDYDAVPSVVYTHPELAMVGLTEDQAKERGLAYRVGRSYLRANARAMTMDGTEGVIKVLAGKADDRVIGIHILGPHASELIGEAALAIGRGLRWQELAETCHAHPTLAESIKEAALAIERRSIHG